MCVVYRIGLSSADLSYWGYTDCLSDWSEATSALLGLITDFLRLQWPNFVIALSWWIGDRYGTKFWPPLTKLKNESQQHRIV